MLEVWYAHLDMAQLLPRFRSLLDPKKTPGVWRAVMSAQAHDSHQAFSKLCRVVDGEPRIMSDPPLIIPIEEFVSELDAAQITTALEAIIGSYQRTLGPDRRRLLDNYRPVHLARKVVVDAVGFGFLIPVFFIASGMSLDFRSLARSPDHLLLIPLFLAGFLLARGLPALLFWRQIGLRSAVALGLLQATTLTVVVVAVDIAVSLKILDLPAGTALIAAALLTELLFPPFALVMLEQVQDERRAP
jgi:hypothetical protein